MTRSIFEGSVRARALNKLNEWLTRSGNKSVWSRVCSGYAGRTITARLSHGDHVERELIHFGSYNYSGLNDRPEVVVAAREALNGYGDPVVLFHTAFRRRLATAALVLR